MSKYIKLEDAEKLLTNALRIAQGFDEPLERSLVDIPTIDIVHCRDCRLVTYTVKNWKTNEIFYACPYSGIQHEGKFFCAYGERIDNE